MTTNTQQLLQSALQQHQAGKLDRAEAAYRQILAQEPNNAPALHYLGLLAHQNGQNQVAAELMQRSLQLQKGNPGFYSNYSAVCRALGHRQDAIDAAQQAIKLAPTFADAHNNLCLVLLDERRYDEAIAAAREALRHNPLHPHAHNNLGLALAETGRLAEAVDMFRQTTTMWPDFLQAHLNLGKALQKLDRFDEAVVPLRLVAEKMPDNHEAVFALAASLVELRLSEEALTAARQATKLRPDDSKSVNMLGVALDVAGRTDEAIAQWERALELDPKNADAHNNLAIVMEKQNRVDDAIARWRQAISIQPDLHRAHANLANALVKQGKYGEAIECCQQIIRARPQFALAYNNLGVALLRDGKHNIEAVSTLRRALELNPRDHDTLQNLGLALERSGESREAVTTYQRAIELFPKSPDSYTNAAVVFSRIGQYDQAEAYSRKALELNPNFPPGHLNLATTMLDRGRVPEALECYRRTLELNPEEFIAFHNLLLGSNYADTMTPEQVAAEHFKFGEKYDRLAEGAPPLANTRDPGRRLRIGYISPDFRTHVVAYFFCPLLTHHDREKFEVFCYANVERQDAMTDYMRSASDHWRDIWMMSHEDAAKLVREDQIDILVDLAGHTAYTLLLVLARRPAPVTCSAIGYPNTTGMKTVDYFITDAYADPPGTTEHLYSEQLWRLPETFWVYRPPAESPEVMPPPCQAVGHVTFGSVNNFSKLTPTVLRLWARLLREVENSQILIQAKTLIDPGTCRYVQEIFEREGVSPSRLLLRPWAAMKEYLELFHSIDIALDPFPYNGGTTTCHALWMGVPVVTLAGAAHLSRMGVSSLMSLGLPELVAESPDQYVEIGKAFALDRDRLVKLRGELRPRMQASPLRAEKRFTRHLETAYREMFTRWCNQA